MQLVTYNFWHFIEYKVLTNIDGLVMLSGFHHYRGSITKADWVWGWRGGYTVFHSKSVGASGIYCCLLTFQVGGASPRVACRLYTMVLHRIFSWVICVSRKDFHRHNRKWEVFFSIHAFHGPSKLRHKINILTLKV